MAQTSEMQQLIDRAAIHDLHTRYFQGIDRGSPEQVRTCFTDDVRAHYDKRTPTRGLAELIGSLEMFNKLRDGSIRITTHFMGNLIFARIEGDEAGTEMNAIAFLVQPAERGDAVAMRSLRYLDRIRREKGGWRISERIHTLDWSCQVPVSFAITLGQRLSTLPVRGA